MLDAGPLRGVHDLLAAATRRHPHRLAIVDGALRLTYAELAARVAALAAALEPHVARGGSLAALGPPSAAQLAFVFVAARLGALYVPLNFRWTDGEVAAALRDCAASVLVVDDPARLEVLCRHVPAGALGVVVVASPAHAPLAPAAAAAAAAAAAPLPPTAACARAVTTAARLLRALPAARDGRADGAAEAPRAARAAGCGEADAWLVYTSGTTGGPKGALLSHASALAHAAFKARTLALERTAAGEGGGGGGGGEAAGCGGAGATYLAAAPLHHVAGLSALAAVVAAAGCVVVPRSTRAPDLRAALLGGRGAGKGTAGAGAPAVDVLVVVPAHLHALVFGDGGDGGDGGAAGGVVSAAVRTVLLGGGYPTAALVAGCFRAFPRASVTLTYAQTEAGSTICTLPLPRPPAGEAAAPAPAAPAPAGGGGGGGGGAAAARRAAAGRVGSAAPFVELAIRDEASGAVHQRPLELGEILVRGGGVFSGYRREPAATLRQLRDGWLHTGDLGALEAGGAAAGGRASLLFVGRRADVVKSGGEAVDASEVERALCSVDSVAEAAVVGVPDGRLGERLVAVLVAAADAPAAGPARDAAVTQACRRLLAGFKLPRELLWWPARALPRTASGKVVKWRLRQDVVRALDARAGAGAGAGGGGVGGAPRARL
jgi:acyl-CoA synthetase (AMP-forming)/AMP-acid ligase II